MTQYYIHIYHTIRMYTLLAMIIVSMVQSKPIAPRRVVYAVDCGGIRELRSSIGVKFQKDQKFSENTIVADYYLEPELSRPHVKYSPDTELYMTERHSEESFQYYIPIHKPNEEPEDANYVLILKFAEEAGRRIFNVKVGERRVLEGLDIFNLVGPAAAHDEYVELMYEDGKVYHNGVECLNALNDENELIVEFEKTEFDNPIINGIFLFRGTLDETDFFDREEYRNDWDRRYANMTREEKKEKREKQVEQRNQEIQRKQDILKIREGFEHEIKEKAEEIPEKVDRPKPEITWELMKFMLMTPIGIVLMIGFFTSTFVLVAFTFFDPYGQVITLTQLNTFRKNIYKREKRG